MTPLKWRLDLGEVGRKVAISPTPRAIPARCKPIVFISYASEDEPEKPGEGEVKWLSFVAEQLRPAEEVGVFDIRIGRMTRAGSRGPERGRGLRACDIFVPLVSPHALSSGYALDQEIATIRERQANGERVCFYPLLLTRDTREPAFEPLGGETPRPREGMRLSGWSGEQRTRCMLDAVDEIVEIAAEMAGPRTWRRSRKESQSSAFVALGSSPPLTIGAGRGIAPDAADPRSLGVWLEEQSPEMVSAIAARAALRAPHGVVHVTREAGVGKDLSLFLVLAGALFRASALARVALKFPARAHEVHAQAQAAAARVAAAPAAATVAAFTTGTTATTHALGSVAAALTCALAAADGSSRDALLALPGVASSPARFAAPVAAPSAAVVSAAVYVGAIAAADGGLRMEIGSDMLALQKLAVGELMDLPLWTRELPDWATDGWERLKTALPIDQDWDVWIEWYEERLSGGSHTEDYELVFASVPQKVWEKGPAVANAWIKEHLPSESGGSRLPKLPRRLTASV